MGGPNFLRCWPMVRENLGKVEMALLKGFFFIPERSCLLTSAISFSKILMAHEGYYISPEIPCGLCLHSSSSQRSHGPGYKNRNIFMTHSLAADKNVFPRTSVPPWKREKKEISFLWLVFISFTRERMLKCFLSPLFISYLRLMFL